MALAAHASDLAGLEAFTDYTRYFRDIRLGMAIGLGFRGRADGYPLLEKLARDPIFTVHRECANAAIQVHDSEMFAGHDVALLKLPVHEPLRPEYSAPGLYEFANREPEPAGIPGTVTLDPHDPQVAIKALQAAVDGTQYKNIGNGFARNAEHMRVFDAGELSKILDLRSAIEQPLSPELDKALQAALDSPYPFAHYLAARLIAVRNEQKFIPQLVEKLPGCVKAADTVGFYWYADALGRLRANAALGVLGQFAKPGTFERTFGPVGMAYGFAAARGVGMIAGDKDQSEIARLLQSENVWLRAGVLDGLIEKADPSVRAQLQKILANPPSAILEEEARYGLKRLTTQVEARK